MSENWNASLIKCSFFLYNSLSLFCIPDDGTLMCDVSVITLKNSVVTFLPFVLQSISLNCFVKLLLSFLFRCWEQMQEAQKK
jgi:hypothetical protein